MILSIHNRQHGWQFSLMHQILRDWGIFVRGAELARGSFWGLEWRSEIGGEQGAKLVGASLVFEIIDDMDLQLGVGKLWQSDPRSASAVAWRIRKDQRFDQGGDADESQVDGGDIALLEAFFDFGFLPEMEWSERLNDLPVMDFGCPFDGDVVTNFVLAVGSGGRQGGELG